MQIINLFIGVLLQFLGGLIAFSIWNFDIHLVPFPKFILGWIILITFTGKSIQYLTKYNKEFLLK